METRTHTPIRPNTAERARTVVAAAASASVLWDGGRVDLLGCHRDGPGGEVILTLDSNSMLVSSTVLAPGGDLPAVVEFTELCPVNTRHRVRSRLSLGGWLSVQDGSGSPDHSCTQLSLDVAEVTFAQDGDRECVRLGDYRTALPDPLHPVAADQLQHLEAHHPDALALLCRLCDPAVLIGVTRVLPVALDRFGIILRIERLRGHTDVRLGFREPITTGAGAVAQLHVLFAEASRRRPCAHRLAKP